MVAHVCNPNFESLSQYNNKFKASLDYTARVYLKTRPRIHTKKKKRRKNVYIHAMIWVKFESFALNKSSQMWKIIFYDYIYAECLGQAYFIGRIFWYLKSISIS